MLSSPPHSCRPDRRASVSVIICTYNYAQFLPQCLQSVIEQTRPADEIIVVDDGSTDRTEDVVAQFPIVRFIKQDHAGKAAAFNRGIAESTSDIICHLDADDYWYHTKLEQVAAAFDEESVGAVTHATTTVNADGHWLVRANDGGDLNRFLLTFEETLLSSFFRPPLNVIRKPIGTSNTISVRREAIADACPFPPEINLTIDTALVLTASRYGLLYLPDILSAYRLHGTNYFRYDLRSGYARIGVFEWFSRSIRSRRISERNLSRALVLENKAQFAMDTGQQVLQGTASAMLAIPHLLFCKRIPTWKHLVLPVACLIQFGRLKSLFKKSAA